MNHTRKRAANLAAYSAIAVAIFTISFVIALLTTFNFEPWDGIEQFAAGFRPLNLLTVYPSILLAISFLIFCVSIHYYISDDLKLWSHLAMNFGLVYIALSMANYLIQLITVMPSLMNNSLEGLEKMVSGYPNSIFFALMGSYFFMCIALFFEGLIFKKRIRFFLFLSSIICMVFFLFGALFSTPILMMLGAISWIVGTVVSMILIAIFLKNEIKQAAE